MGRNCCSIDRSRRDFLLKSAGGLGALSLLELFGAQAQPAADTTSTGLLGTGQIPARAKPAHSACPVHPRRSSTAATSRARNRQLRSSN
jgi:hypothetical protein